MNDKRLLQEKADALRRDLSELDAQISKLPSQPESVKPRIESYTERVSNICMGPKSLALCFDTPEQAEKAKAILEKMEFGEPPPIGTPIQRTRVSGGVTPDIFSSTWTPDWHFGLVKIK